MSPERRSRPDPIVEVAPEQPERRGRPSEVIVEVAPEVSPERRSRPDPIVEVAPDQPERRPRPEVVTEVAPEVAPDRERERPEVIVEVAPEVAPEARARRGDGGGGAFRVALDLKARSAPVGGGTAAGSDHDAAVDRSRLLDLLRQEGILHASESQPVLSGDGTPARWMLDSLPVTLAPPGADLAAHCLLRLLDGFEGRQLATYGLTGVPLVQGCVLHGAGRYRGVLVRKERKPHGSRKLIEGKLDLAEPVVIVDDSVSSGRSMLACADALEAAGFQVEGGICLVRFDYERGFSRMIERGYRMAAVFDIREDFMRHMDGESPVPLNPTKDLPQLSGLADRGRRRPASRRRGQAGHGRVPADGAGAPAPAPARPGATKPPGGAG